jgi:glycosyltransferase involved in cell wall biosynthesis
MRVAIVFDNFGPYHMARLVGAARTMQVLGVEVAATGAEYDWDAPDTPQGLERVRLLDNASERSNGSLLSAAYVDRVGPWRADAIALPGWSSPAALAGARWAAARGIPTVVMSETNAGDFPRHIITELIKRRLMMLFQAGLAGGTLARAYLADLGLPYDRTFVGYDVVDNDFFTRGAQAARETNTLSSGFIDPAWRGRYFLASARFVPKKNLPRLIEAFARYRQAAGSAAWPLVLLGEGPMRSELERRRAELGLQASLVMPGFKQYGELPLYYGNAGAFVHVSTTEQWGLVVNEAMASRLPVLVSDRSGCSPDLVESGRNGDTFDPHDVDALARLMLEVASDGCNRAAMGHASWQIIGRWSPETFAEGLRRATVAALHAGSRQPGLFDRTLLWALSRR